ncbi:MAG: cephalosporin hydroxylase family protein [Candidatus Thermoplasmatota archaeon]|nr:cephalosporin hydroxylase family protein [Candidatus Thermoplasmatota archaeon]
MKLKTNRIFEVIHAFMHDHDLVSGVEPHPVREPVQDSGAFENYLNYFHTNCHEDEEAVKWMGKKAKKFPMDTWIYQEIIHDIKPDAIIEIGNLSGGSTLFLANMLDLLNNGKVIGIDIDHSEIDFKHPRITWITGDANSAGILSKVDALIRDCRNVLVIEDSSHTYENTLNVLRNYNRFVTVDSYFIVEDGICKYDFVDGPKPGPYDAVHDFLRENTSFEVDRTKEKFVLTYNPSGYLKKVR